MPQIKLTPAEGLLVAMNDEEARDLEARGQALMREAQQKRALVLGLVFESHNEPKPEGVPVSVVPDAQGRPASLEWAKKAEG